MTHRIMSNFWRLLPENCLSTPRKHCSIFIDLYFCTFLKYFREKTFEMDLICGYSEESSSEEEAPEEVEEEKPKKPKVWLPPPDLTTASMKERFRNRIMQCPLYFGKNFSSFYLADFSKS